LNFELTWQHFFLPHDGVLLIAINFHRCAQKWIWDGIINAKCFKFWLLSYMVSFALPGYLLWHIANAICKRNRLHKSPPILKVVRDTWTKRKKWTFMMRGGHLFQIYQCNWFCIDVNNIELGFNKFRWFWSMNITMNVCFYMESTKNSNQKDLAFILHGRTHLNNSQCLRMM
jgi:hypothetical protein